MKAQEYLEAFNDYGKIAHRLEVFSSESLRDLEQIKTHDYKILSRSVGKNTLDLILQQIEDNCKRSKRLSKQYRRMQQEILQVIKSAPGVEGTLLYHRYVLCEAWESVSEAIAYSWTQTFRYHQLALELIQERLDADESQLWLPAMASRPHIRSESDFISKQG